MKGDFSRFSFDRSKRYSGVRLQQGRVQLDADWNEQLDIADYIRRTTIRDIVGAAGAPDLGASGEKGFEITVSNGVISIGVGHYYVDGALCENHGTGGDPTPIDQQPDLPGYQPPTVDGYYFVYLDVWQRHITALEDPDLLELALGGPDTSTRAQTVWQVKLLHAGATQPACQDFVPVWTVDGGLAPELEARTLGAPAENQLYRVEVHRSGDLDTATFKWSRDNGIAAARIDNPSLSQIRIVHQIGQDVTRGFAAGQWVEVTDEQRLLSGEPGTFARLATVAGQILTVEGWPGGGDPAPDLPARAIVRRWDSESLNGELDVVRPATNDGYIALEDGVEIRFGSQTGRSYRTGDYWLIPTRARSGVLWPEDQGGDPIPNEPHGVEHHFAPLAIVYKDSSGWSLVPTVPPCRSTFKPTTECPGPEKVSKTGDDMSGPLTINADLTVTGSATVGGLAGSRLQLDQAPIVASNDDHAERGLLFPSIAGTGEASMRYFDSGGSGKMRLALAGSGTLALSENGSDLLTISSGRVGIGATGVPAADLHVEGDTFLFSPSSEMRIEGPLVIRDGSEGAGKVLTSDAAGRASWKSPLGTDDEPAPTGPVFLDLPVLIGTGSGAKDWTELEITTDRIPKSPSAVIIQAWATMAGPDSGDTDSVIRFRKGPSEATYFLLVCRAAGGGDNAAWGGQGLFPIKDGKLQYTVEPPGLSGWGIEIIGYFP